MLRYGLVLTALCVLVVGCGSPTPSAPTAAGVKEDPLSLRGPGGTVKLQDDLAAAKKAFPVPKGAKVSESPLSFAMLHPEGWGWATQEENQAFEVATEKGKIVAINRVESVEDAKQHEGLVKETKSTYGEPTKEAVGKTASIYVWDRGENVRFLVLSSGFMGNLQMSIIGNKESLKMLNYRADDPGVLVKQLDLATEQLSKLPKR